MNSLEWVRLTETFYDFKYNADKHGFYTEQLKEMEESIYRMKPFKEVKKQ